MSHSELWNPTSHYQPSELEDLLKVYNKYVFFTGGWLSNHAASFFATPFGPFNCSEQYMMAAKALLFNDVETYEKIMFANSPGEQKGLGRTVKGFNKEEWEKVARKVVYQGCYYKFTQNGTARDYLLSTQGYLLVEAAPWDQLWGIGISAQQASTRPPSEWQGRNWLGCLLTDLREKLLQECSCTAE